MNDPASLRRRFPRRWDVPLLALIALGLLIAALALPTLRMSKVIFFTETYSIWGGIVELWKQDHPGLAALVFFFSIVFPVGKLLALLAVWFVPLRSTGRRRAVHWVEVFGKWSMLDVYVVATLIVLIKAQDVADAEARTGIYLFAAAILLSMAATGRVQSLARRAEATPADPS